MRARALWALALGSLIWQGQAIAGQAVCSCTADTSIGSVGREADQNSGTAERIKIKGRENQLLMKFDLSGVPKDAVITSASLKVHMTDPKFRLHQVAVSSVSTDWVEGAGQQVDDEGKASVAPAVCWNRPGPKVATWAGSGSTIADVSWGNGGSVENYGFAKHLDGEWWTMPVDPRVIAAMRADSYGLLVQDESGWWEPKLSNVFVHSREKKNFAPTLTVEWADADKVPPSPVKDITASTDDLDDGQVVLTFTCGGDDGDKGTALGYEIRCLAGRKITAANFKDARLAPRWQTPRPKAAGQTVKAWITGLVPGDKYYFAIITYDQSGNRSVLAVSDPVKLPKTDAPRLAALKALPVVKGSPAEVSGKMALWATDELTKVDPVSGKVLDGSSYIDSDARNGSHVWDGKTHTMRLTALKGEVAAFNLVIETLDGSLSNVQLKPAALGGPDGKAIAAGTIVPHRVWYEHETSKDGKTTYYGDPVPVLNRPLEIPAEDNKVVGQKNQSVYVDLYVPKDIPAGTYRGPLTVASSAGEGKVNVEVDVLDLQMPDQLSYVIEMNAYGWTQPTNIDAWFAMHRLAHRHRLGYNVLEYGHCDSVTVPFLPKIEGEGAKAKVADWSEWDRWMGPLLDGSAFKDLPRGPVPIPHYYLPFHENYPTKVTSHYAKPEFYANEPKNDKGAFDFVAWKDRLSAEDVDIRNAFDQTWQEQGRAIAEQYRQHFIDKGWTKTQFQIFCNNKLNFREPKTQNPNETGAWQHATALWTLDEPSYGRDFRALNYIYSVFKPVLVGAPLDVIVRGDISRPEWQGDRCDGTVDTAVISSALYNYQEMIQARRFTQGSKFWFYGGGNGADSDNTGLAAVYIKTWTMGTDGGLAQYTNFVTDENWDTPDRLALVYMKDAHGYKAPVATTRLKAERRAEQDIELMNMLAAQPGWNRTRVARAVAAAINLTSKTVAHGADDPGQTSFKDVHAADLAKIRLALAKEILAAKASQSAGK